MEYKIPVALCTLALGLSCFAAFAGENLSVLLLQAPNDAARTQLLAPMIKTNPQGTLALVAQLKKTNSGLAKDVLQDVLVLLAQKPTRMASKVSHQLVASNADLVEQLADEAANVEAAAGPESSHPSFSIAAPLPVPLENPNQISANQP